MREYELEVLEQYDMEIRGTRKIRGAFFCETSEGIMLLKEANISERRALLMHGVLERLEQEKGMKADTPVFTCGHELLAVSGDGTKYMLKKWFAGKECDVKREWELMAAAETMARLHAGLSAPEDLAPPARRSPLEEMVSHNREMRKVRSFIRSRTARTPFEYLYLENFSRMYDLAEKVCSAMESSGCRDLYRQSVREKRISHGDYNYHNVLILSEGTAVTNFEHMNLDIQVRDLSYFLRKVMEKHRWKQKTGRNILEAYESIRPLSREEKEFIGLTLAYPEKFWKTASSYYHSNKAWISEKSVEKLGIAVEQTEDKNSFLENVFALKLRG